MTLGERWAHRPQNVWLRRALFQVHLWTGIGLGLYVFAISVSGSAIVYRNALYKKFAQPPITVDAVGERLTHPQMKQAAQAAHPGYLVSYIFDGRSPTQAVEIWMRRGDKQLQRLFDPYTGRDLAPAVPPGIRALAWMADLHTNLLGGQTGRAVNGGASALLVVMSLSGLVIWWPGVANWRRSLKVNWQANWKRLNWELHSAIGFWMFLFVFMWAVTGVLLVFPRPYQNLIAHFTPINQFRRRGQPLALGDQILRWPAYLHFGNRWGVGVQALWVIFGLVPVVLLVTGCIMWWNRVLAPAWKRTHRSSEPARV